MRKKPPIRSKATQTKSDERAEQLRKKYPVDPALIDKRREPSARQDLDAGLLSAKTKPLVDLGDFTQYLDEEDK